MSEASIFNIQRYSLHDGGGIRTIVFFKGCHCSCPWCCNPESLNIRPQQFMKESLCMNCSKKVEGICKTNIDDCPTGAKSQVGEWKRIEDIFEVIKRDRTFYETSGGGVTLSGGEVLLQEECAIELLKMCKAQHIHTAIESTLSLPIKYIAELVANVDVFLVDFKIMDKTKSHQVLHLDVDQMQQNVEAIMRLGAKVIARIPLIPTYTSIESNLNAIILELTRLHIQEVHILPFHQLGASKYKSIDKQYACTSLRPHTEQEISEIKELFESHGFIVNVHGA